MATFKCDRVVVLAPHTDDAELACGATVARLLDDGAKVSVVVFSDCKQSVPEGLPPGILRRELMAATKALGIAKTGVRLLDYPVRTFGEHRQAILEDILRVKRELDPDVVFMPSLDDVHQDHQVIAKEGLRGCKDRTILCYEMPWNNLSFGPNFYVAVEKRHMTRKLRSVRCYKSQQARAYAQDEFLLSLARVRGTQVGAAFAEAFQAVRCIV